MSKRMPSQTPDHSFVGHLHPTHFLLYPVIAPQKEAFFTIVIKKKLEITIRVLAKIKA